MGDLLLPLHVIPEGDLLLKLHRLSSKNRHFDRSCSRFCEQRSGEIRFSTHTFAKPTSAHLPVSSHRALCDGGTARTQPASAPLLLPCSSCHPRRAGPERSRMGDCFCPCNFFSAFSAQKSHVKPHNPLTLSSSSSYKWHVSSSLPAIIKVVIKDPGHYRGLVLRRT
jgi:hypothetical protein